MVMSQVLSFICSGSGENAQCLSHGQGMIQWNITPNLVSNRLLFEVLEDHWSCLLNLCLPIHYGPLAELTPSGWVGLCRCFPGDSYQGWIIVKKKARKLYPACQGLLLYLISHSAPNLRYQVCTGSSCQSPFIKGFSEMESRIHRLI